MEKPLDNSCRWIYGDVKSGTATWCAQPTKCGQPWCKDHRRQVYVVGRHSSPIKPPPKPAPQEA